MRPVQFNETEQTKEVEGQSELPRTTLHAEEDATPVRNMNQSSDSTHSLNEDVSHTSKRRYRKRKISSSSTCSTITLSPTNSPGRKRSRGRTRASSTSSSSSFPLSSLEGDEANKPQIIHLSSSSSFESSSSSDDEKSDSIAATEKISYFSLQSYNSTSHQTKESETKKILEPTRDSVICKNSPKPTASGVSSDTNSRSIPKIIIKSKIPTSPGVAPIMYVRRPGNSPVNLPVSPPKAPTADHSRCNQVQRTDKLKAQIANPVTSKIGMSDTLDLRMDPACSWSASTLHKAHNFLLIKAAAPVRSGVAVDPNLARVTPETRNACSSNQHAVAETGSGSDSNKTPFPATGSGSYSNKTPVPATGSGSDSTQTLVPMTGNGFNSNQPTVPEKGIGSNSNQAACPNISVRSDSNLPVSELVTESTAPKVPVPITDPKAQSDFTKLNSPGSSNSEKPAATPPVSVPHIQTLPLSNLEATREPLIPTAVVSSPCPKPSLGAPAVLSTTENSAKTIANDFPTSSSAVKSESPVGMTHKLAPMSMALPLPIITYTDEDRRNKKYVDLLLCTCASPDHSDDPVDGIRSDIFAHRIMLEQIPFVRKHLTPGSLAADVISIPGYNAAAVEAVVGMYYSRELFLKETFTLEDLFTVTEKFEIEDLVNCWTVKAAAEEKQNRKVLDILNSYILKNLAKLIENPLITNVSFDQINDYITEATGMELHQVLLLKAVVTWASADLNNRKEHIFTLLSKLDLGRIFDTSPRILRQVFAPGSLLSSIPACVQLHNQVLADKAYEMHNKSGTDDTDALTDDFKVKWEEVERKCKMEYTPSPMNQRPSSSLSRFMDYQSGNFPVKMERLFPSVESTPKQHSETEPNIAQRLQMQRNITAPSDDTTSMDISDLALANLPQSSFVLNSQANQNKSGIRSEEVVSPNVSHEIPTGKTTSTAANEGSGGGDITPSLRPHNSTANRHDSTSTDVAPHSNNVLVQTPASLQENCTSPTPYTATQSQNPTKQDTNPRSTDRAKANAKRANQAHAYPSSSTVNTAANKNKPLQLSGGQETSSEIAEPRIPRSRTRLGSSSSRGEPINRALGRVSPITRQSMRACPVRELDAIERVRPASPLASCSPSRATPASPRASYSPTRTNLEVRTNLSPSSDTESTSTVGLSSPKLNYTAPVASHFLLYPVSKQGGRYLEIFDFRDNMNHQVHLMKRPREFSCLAQVENCVYDIGGSEDGINASIWDSMESSDFVDVFTKDHLESRPGYNTVKRRRCFSASVSSTGDAIYVIGGDMNDRYQNVVVSNVVEKLDMQVEKRKRRWKINSFLNHPRSCHASVFLGNSLYTAGGIGKSDGGPHASDAQAMKEVEIFCPKEASWLTVQPMQVGRRCFKLFSWGNRMYAIGGEDKVARPLNSVEAYNPDEDRWESLAPMNCARSNFGVFEMDGCIYVVGGNSDKPNDQNIEFYNPSTNVWKLLPWPKFLNRHARLNSSIAISQEYARGIISDVEEPE